MYNSALIGSYTNGNYNVKIYEDGTKIRENDLDNFRPEFPESIDLKITNYCKFNCPMCHEESGLDGQHGNLSNVRFIDSLTPYTELAIGGGDPYTHPGLLNFLYMMKTKGVLSNITIKQETFMENEGFTKLLIDQKLIRGLGISVSTFDQEFLDRVKLLPDVVLHVIAGYTPVEEIMKYSNNGLKILILGYKQFGRGADYMNQDIRDGIIILNNSLVNIIKGFKIVSFDNLALKQLRVKDLLTAADWETFYMGDDGQYTMYVDLVNEEFAKNSTSEMRYNLMGNIVDMFNTVHIEIGE